jgi:hypothetical protein
MYKNLICLITLFFTFIAEALFAQKTPEDLVKDDWPNIYANFGNEVEKIPLNFIFVLDISDKTFGNDIKAVVKDFLKPVKNGDYFNVILLGSTDKTTNLTECAIVDNSKKTGIIKQVDNQNFGTTGSDGVKMTGLVIDAMNCAGAKDATPVVFIFSDFVHYSNGWSVPGDQFWNPLLRKYDQQKNENSFIYCIQLPNVDRKPQYLDKIKNIFKNANTVSCNDPKLLDDKFNNIKGNLIKSLLREIINKKINLEKNNIALTYIDNAVSLKGGDSLIYSQILLDNESKVKVEKIVKSELLYSFLPPSEKQIEVSGFIIAEKYKKELPELTDIELKNHKIILLTADSLIPWWLTDIIVLILILIVWRFIWTIIPPARLKGTIDFYVQGKNTEVFDCSGRYKKFSNNEVKILKNGFSLEIRATKTFFHGKCLILIPMNGDLLLSSRKQKITARGGKKTIARVKSQWNVDGIEITMPNIK